MRFFLMLPGKLFSFELAKALFALAILLKAATSQSFPTSFNDSIHPVDFPEAGLEAGDKVPESFWDIRLKMINHPDGQEYVSLRDYKGKLIILDFWDTRCSACIGAMPKLDSIQKELAGEVVVLPVTYQSGQEIAAFQKKNKVFRGVELPIAVEDTVLRRFFPHTIIPHIVWIGQSGTVKAITGTNEVTLKNVHAVTNGKQADLWAKRDQLNYDRYKPLLVDGNGGGEDEFLYRSIITGFLDGVPGGRSIQTDEERRIMTIKAVNRSVIELYAFAFRKAGEIFSRPNRIIVDVPKPTKYQYIPRSSEPDKRGRSAWYSQNAYCYELILPLARSAAASRYMREDLNRFFGLDGKLEKRTTACYFLKDIATKDRIRTSGGKRSQKLSPDGTLTLQNSKISSLEYWLSKVPGMLPVIDKTNYKYKVDLVLDLGSDEASLRKQLRQYGLDLVRGISELKYFVLKENLPE